MIISPSGSITQRLTEAATYDGAEDVSMAPFICSTLATACFSPLSQDPSFGFSLTVSGAPQRRVP